MVRVFIKGGVWKNSEDEILKAAVMKYGKQQWARVASLLNRKSAKQCKARWNEWLDPSVRKVEWSRAEDEKLLYLAKLMPAQWRTIGPLLGGRSGVQCLERYERLLDEAASTSAEGAEAATTAIPTRRLRPGEIDPHPETKPARPDPIDMDEDEIEMLQEARARLANTQGKKAKRKAREKMLNEAKRLADLQKRRELKQAGLLSSAARLKSKKKRREIDYGVEIPFHKPPPAGFHSTLSEERQAQLLKEKRLKDVDFKRVNEAQYRSRDREEKSAQKKEEARLRRLERSNMEYVVAEVSKKNDPLALRKRGTLNMPEPTGDLEQFSAKKRKLDGGMNTDLGSGLVTDVLMGEYTDRPLPTPMRTPHSSSSTAKKLSSQEVILREATNLKLLQSGETPLLGGENPELMAGGVGTGASLFLNKGNDDKSIVGTESVATPRTFVFSGDATNTHRVIGNQTPLSHSARDELGLNHRPDAQSHSGLIIGGDDVSLSGTSFATSIGTRHTLTIKELAREQRRAAKLARQELELALASLPAPQFEYTLAAIPDDDDNDDDLHKSMTMQLAKDAADVDAEEVARWEREAEKLYQERSSVLKRVDLPRPAAIVHRSAVFGEVDGEDKKFGVGSSVEEEAFRLINEEMLALMQHDAYTHPVVELDSEAVVVEAEKKKGGKKSKNNKSRKKRESTVGNDTALDGPPPMPDKSLDYVTGDMLDLAKSMLDREMEVVIEEKKSTLREMNLSVGTDEELWALLTTETIKESTDGSSSQLYLHDDKHHRKGWVNTSNNNGESIVDNLSALRLEYIAMKETANTLRDRADKMEHKLDIKNGGYKKRADAIQNSILQTFAEVQHSKIEEVVYTNLMGHETRGMRKRMDKLKEEIEELENKEGVAQKRYGDLLHERNRLLLLQRRQKQQMMEEEQVKCR